MQTINNNLFKLDKTNKYRYALVHNHPCANTQGKVYEHVYVMCKYLGRLLEKDEVVHHLDRNRQNNSINNLELMNYKEHVRLHLKEDKEVEFITRLCLHCGKSFNTTKRVNKKCCCVKCSRQTRLVLSKEEIELLSKQVWEMPTTKVAQLYNITDVAVSKRCKKYNIPKPPRGYWRKVETSTL